MDTAIRASHAVKRTLAQCNYGSIFRAYTTFAGSSWLQFPLEVCEVVRWSMGVRVPDRVPGLESNERSHHTN